MDRLTIFGTADEKTTDQAINCLEAEEGAIGVLCGDNHLGYSQPIGMAVAYREHISPSGVGYDIGCGNKAVGTGIYLDEQDVNVICVMDDIFKLIDFGAGWNQLPNYDHPVIDAIAEHPFLRDREDRLLEKAITQLGSVGGGNHYVDLFEADDHELVVGVHFGSRGFGHTIASEFFGDSGGMFAAPTLLKLGTPAADEYLSLMALAGRYAYAGRDLVVGKVLEILGAGEPTWAVHNHHNFAWHEEHFGEQFWVVRKGCTPAFPGQPGFVGATMGEVSVLLEGNKDAGESAARAQEDALYSTVHGAGRAMSRTEARGKVKKGRVVRPGKVDWDSVKIAIEAGGIELRGAAADEAPQAYKRLSSVLAAQGDTITVTGQLRPIGVAMAPSGVRADD